MKVKLESLQKLLSNNWCDNTKDLIAELEIVRAKFKQVNMNKNKKGEDFSNKDKMFPVVKLFAF